MFFVPVHGEYRQLYAHALLAQEVGIPKDRIILAETGDVIALEPNSVRLDGKAQVGRRLIDEGGVADLMRWWFEIGNTFPKRAWCLPGSDQQSYRQIEGHRIGESRPRQEGEGMAFLTEARQIIIKTLEECTDEERKDALVLSETIRAELKRYFRKRTGTGL